MGMRILVVDDEDTLRRVIGRVLRRDGHEITEAPSAEKALEAFRREPFPLVLTDVVMGKMSGLELLEEIKVINPETLVVVMTSHASLEAATAALRSGAYDFLTKPFEELDAISAVVNRAAEKIRLLEVNQGLMQRLKDYTRDLEELNATLAAMANRDGLTGLYNHRYFRQALEVEIARAFRHNREFSLIFIDIDHFKAYNDTHGHLAGDEVLKTLGQLIQQGARKHTVAARYGGEEFVLLVPEVDRDGARVYAEKTRRAAEEYPFAGRESLPSGKVTLSLGVACYPDDGEDGRTLVDCADKALYQAKHGGRNRVVMWGEDAALERDVG